MPTKRAQTKQPKQPPLPQLCDFDCTHASFPPGDIVGACRKEQAVYCTLLKKFNNRHNKCLAR
jgi:hypothetical protein